MNTLIYNALHILADDRSNRLGIGAMRVAIAIIFIWIGLLKFVPYEADSITPFVANSPIMSFFYADPQDYKGHLTKEGELVQPQRNWQLANRTYAFSTGLGIVELIIGFTTLSGFFTRWGGLIGALLAFATPFVTLSFLVTTPEAWVPALGDAEHGFPYLSGPGRLVLKDVAILAGAWLIIADTARGILLKTTAPAKNEAPQPIAPHPLSRR